MKKIAESHSQHSFSFDSIISKPVSFRLIHAAHLEYQARQFIQIKLQVDVINLSEILDAQWFNYHPSVVLQDVQFTAASPITLTLVLAPAVTAQLLQKDYELEHFLAALYKVNKDYISAVSQQENWFIVEAKQEQPTDDLLLPEDANTKLSFGFKTSWYSTLVKELILERKLSTPEVPSQTLMHEVTNLLIQQRIEYVVDEANLYIEFGQGAITWTEIIRINETDRVITCYANFPEAIPLAQLERVALVLMNENYSLEHGAFELDYEDGDLRFRSTVLAFSQLDISHLAQVLGEHIEIMEQYIPAINQYINSNE